MYRDLKQSYWWSGMKREIANYVSKCLVCQQIKAKHQRPAKAFDNTGMEKRDDNGGFYCWITKV